MRQIQNVLVVPRHGNERAERLAGKVHDFLTARGVACVVAVNCPDSGPEAFCARNLKDAMASPDLALVLGGDGTMLSVVRKLAGSDIPLLGVNLGRVGFLTEASADGWQALLETLLRDGLSPEGHMMLDATVLRDGQTVFAATVANDVTVSRGAMARLINLRVAHEGVLIGLLRADGILVSTPVGSTAYGVSAGGPLIRPEMEAMCLTPICPFLFHNRPMVLPARGPLDILVEDNGPDVFLTADGQQTFPLRERDLVRIEPSRQKLWLVRPLGDVWFAKLREKGFFLTP